MAWQPLLEGDLAARARDAVRAIAEDIPRVAPTDPGLPSGQAGLAVFYAYLSYADEGSEDVAQDYLVRAADAIADVPLPPALHGGFSGVAWAVEHLCASPDDPADLNGDIDSALLELMSSAPWPDTYDLIGGPVGIGVYALERSGRPLGRALLDAVVARVAEMAEPAADGLTILTPPGHLIPETRERYPDGQYNLGVAHGVPAVIGLFGSAPGDQARHLREGLTAWMRSIRHVGPDGSLYPYAIDRRDPQPNAGCRAAWCYGDPGIAVALLRGARAAGDAALEEMALEIGRTVAARPPATAGVVDAGLCHGSAGLLHIFNRLYQATGDEAFRAAAMHWAGDTLAQRLERSEGVAGYRSYRRDDSSPWVADATLLTGATGIALALLAATTDIEPRWDVTLLCDVPPR